MKLHKNIFFLIASAFALTVTSCVSENLENCDNIRPYSFNLDLEYKRYLDADNIIENEVGVVSVVLYDSTGRYIKTVTENVRENLPYVGDMLRVNVQVNEPGKYRFVVLGDTDSPEYKIVEEAATRASVDIDYFSVTAQDYEGVLNYEFKAETYIATERTVIIEESEVYPPKDTTVVSAELFKNNKHVDIFVSGLSKQVDDNIVLSFSDNNLSFNKDNITTGDVEYMPYEPTHIHPGVNNTADGVTHEFRYETLRMMREEPLVLDIKVSTGTEIHTEESVDLMELIRSVRYGDGALLYPKQLDMDYEDHYNIILRYGKNESGSRVLVQVLVNDWEVTQVTPLPL